MVSVVKELICVLLIGLAVSAQAEAAPVSYTFEASFFEEAAAGLDANDVPASSLFAQARVLSSISGVLTFDEPDRTLSATDGRVHFVAPVTFRLDQLGVTIKDDTGFAIIENAEGDPADFITEDRVFFQAGAIDVPTNPDQFFGGLISLRLIDSTNAAVSDLSLPNDLVFSDFDSAFLSVVVLNIKANDNGMLNVFGSAFVDFKIDRFERLSEVPVPAALPLFLAGVAGLAAFLRRRKLTANNDGQAL